MTPRSWLNNQEVDGGVFHWNGDTGKDQSGIEYYEFSFGCVEFEATLRHPKDDAEQSDKHAWNLEKGNSLEKNWLYVWHLDGK